MICRLCNQDRKLVKAHIIPQAFWRQSISGEDKKLLISSSPSFFSKRSPIGVYDNSILCAQCEPEFNQMDDYGIELLLKRAKHLFKPIEYGGHKIGLQAGDVDNHKLLVFLIGVLWRASISTQPFYKRVNLGALEPLAREVILNQSGSLPATFDALLSYWTVENDSDDLTKCLMDPFFERWNGINAYRFYFGRFVAYIKADKRNFSDEMQKFGIRSSSTLIVPCRTYEKSKDFGVLNYTFIQSQIISATRNTQYRH